MRIVEALIGSAPLNAVRQVRRSSEGSLNHQGSYALALARHFGNLDFENSKQGNAIYFNTIGSGIVHYPAWLSLPLSGLVILALFYVVWLGLH